MDVVIVNQREVAQLLSMAECIAVMENVLADLARGECQLPLRQIMWMPDKSGALGLMPSYWSPARTIGLKAVTFFPGNEGTELDSHQGAVMLFEAERGRLLAMVDATSITAIRTAAVSAVATRLLARPDARRLALIGCGVQARTHLEAMLCCRPISHVRVCSKTLDSAEVFAREESEKRSVSIEATASVREAVEGAEIICTTTSSTEPVLEGDWLDPGVHINAIGSSVAFARELDARAVARSMLFVDCRESALSEAGDFLLARKEGAVTNDHIRAEIGELLIGKEQGRTTPEKITLFKSVGIAVEDLAAARHVYEKARKTGMGTTLEFGGGRRASD